MRQQLETQQTSLTGVVREIETTRERLMGQVSEVRPEEGPWQGFHHWHRHHDTVCNLCGMRCMLLQLHWAGTTCAMCRAHGTELQHVHSHAGGGAWSCWTGCLVTQGWVLGHTGPACFCTQTPAQEREGTHPKGISLPLIALALQQPLVWLYRVVLSPLSNADTTLWSDECPCLCPFPTTPQAESHLAAQRAAVEEAEAAVQEALRRLREAEVGPNSVSQYQGRQAPHVGKGVRLLTHI